MRKLYTFNIAEKPQAALLKERLEQEGIACLLRNVDLSSALGEIPFLECLPELWVLDDEMFPRARMLLKGWTDPGAGNSKEWICAGCGESLEGQFDACWKCGRLRD
jgi:hypothetical protein